MFDIFFFLILRTRWLFVSEPVTEPLNTTFSSCFGLILIFFEEFWIFLWRVSTRDALSHLLLSFFLRSFIYSSPAMSVFFRRTFLKIMRGFGVVLIFTMWWCNIGLLFFIFRIYFGSLRFLLIGRPGFSSPVLLWVHMYFLEVNMDEWLVRKILITKLMFNKLSRF